uniref:PX domain-containing protein n=1 Tax=Peronospora matthiolae TaxID=2874970 RepID=A0AAV1V536_9STRA
MEPIHVPALTAKELSFHTRELVKRHVIESIDRHHSVPLDELLQCSRYTSKGRNSVTGTRFSCISMIPDYGIIGTTVRFLDVVRASDHCTFMLLVDTGKEQFVVQRRYSEFRELRQQVLRNAKVVETAAKKGRKRQCPNGACQLLAQQLAVLKFPRRKLKFGLHRDDDIKTARERQAPLQHFIEPLLAVYRMAPKRQVRCCVNTDCRVLNAVRLFLDIRDLGEEELAGWKSNSHGTTCSDEVSAQDIPPSVISSVSPLSTADTEPNESPSPRDTSVTCLDELYTIMEDTEHSLDMR